MPSSVEDLLRRHARPLSERSGSEAHWSQVAQVVLPRSGFFLGRRIPGGKHTEDIMIASIRV